MSKRQPYADTDVPVARSQQAIRELILRNGGTAVAFVSQPPVEGFEAMVEIEGKSYRIRITAQVPHGVSPERTVQQERRIWRVLFYHLKATFTAATSGVLELRELILPYMVVRDGLTVAEHLLPQLDQALAGKPERLLPAATPEREL